MKPTVKEATLVVEKVHCLLSNSVAMYKAQLTQKANLHDKLNPM